MSSQKKIILVALFFAVIVIIVFVNYRFDADKQPNQAIQTFQTSVLIFADENVYNSLTNELNRLKDDIAKDLGAEVVIQHGIYTNPIEIREAIKNFNTRKKVLGSILIGDIPTFYRDDGLYTDWFYQDLSNRCPLTSDGKFADTLSCNTLDAVSRREIFSGRITPPVKGAEGIALIKKYLDKNHDYRSGNISFEKRLLVYPAAIINDINNKSSIAIKNSLDSNLDFSLSRLDRYSRPSVDFIKETNYENAKSEYLDKLKMNSYEAALINIHGTALGQFVSGGFGEAEVSYQDIKNIAPSIFYVNLLSCSNGAFEESNYMAGWFLFSGNTMVVNAQSRTAYIGGFIEDPPLEPIFFIRLNALGSNDPIGDMIRRDDSLFVTQTFGDPTLQLPVNKNDGSRLSASKQAIDFGLGSTVKTETITIRNTGSDTLTLRRLPDGGLTVNDSLPSNYTLDTSIEPLLGVNFLGFELPSVNPFAEVEVLPDEEVVFNIGFAPAAFQESKLLKKGKYFDIMTFITNDYANPYLDIELRAEVQ